MLAHGGVIVKYTTTENENILIKTQMHAVLAASLLANNSKKTPERKAIHKLL